MPSRAPGDQPDPAELLGRWQAHVAGTEASGGDQTSQEPTAGSDEPSAPALPPASAAAPAAPNSSDAPENPENPEKTVAGKRRGPGAPDQVGPSTDVVFAPRVVLRRLLGAMVLVLLPATAAAGYVAYTDPRTLTVGLAGILLVVTLTVYAVRVGSTPPRLAIRSGQLEVVKGNHREVFDLTSRFTRLEVVGKPGRPGWKVLMARFGRDPLVIDASMVDPTKFTAALERHRPHAR